jgi:alpha-D-xyloside xylohydrolase
VPWLFDEEAVDVLRHFTQLKCRLMPYLYAKAVEAHHTGVPVMRAMMLEFPDDPACDYLDRQYMLGDSLLVAPVFSSNGSVDYYVPAGRWTHLLSEEMIQGPGWRRENHDFFSLPVLVRPNTVLPVGSNFGRPDYEYADGITLEVFGLEDGSDVCVSIPHLDGTAAMGAHFVREGQNIFVVSTGAKDHWRILLVGIHQLEKLEGASWERTVRGTMVLPEDGANSITISLSS